MLSGSQFEIVQYLEVITREDCDRVLPDDAAVYAWFRDLTLPEDVIASEKRFVDAITILLDESSSETRPFSVRREGRVPPFYNVGITVTPGSLTPTKSQALQHYAKTESLRQEIGDILSAMTFWQPPLYIGKSDNLANRIWQHVSRETELGNRLEEVGLSLNQCVLAYLSISNAADGATPLVQLVEDIITRLSSPGFVLRIG